MERDSDISRINWLIFAGVLSRIKIFIKFVPSFAKNNFQFVLFLTSSQNSAEKTTTRVVPVISSTRFENLIYFEIT